MNSRRLMFPPRLREDQRIESDEGLEGPKMNFPHATRMSALGQKQTFCAAKSDVRFTPESDRKSGFPHKVMSALPPKADIRSAPTHVRGPGTDTKPVSAGNYLRIGKWEFPP